MAIKVELLLNRIKVLENAETGDFKAATFVHFSLVWPNVVTSTRHSVKALKLQSGLEVDYVNGINPDTNRPYSYTDRIIFKEEIVGRTELTTSVVTVEQTPRVAKVLATLFGVAVDVAWTLAVGGVANVIVGAAMDNLGQSFGRRFGIRSERSTPIGDALLPIDEKNPPQAPQSITLIAPEDVTISQLVMDSEDDRAYHVTRQVCHKNGPNGFVEIEVNLIGG